MKDLIELGSWLNKESLDSFGKEIKQNDVILHIKYENSEFLIDRISRKYDLNLKENYYFNSIYKLDSFITTNQNIMIPSKSHLMGLSPFCLKLDHDFIKKNKKNDTKIKKFKRKIEDSHKSNKNNKSFISVLKELYDDNKELLNCLISEKSKKDIIGFFNKHSFDDIKILINSYYEFLKFNSDIIIDKVIEYKNSDAYEKNEKSSFYLICTFNSEFDLINDIFYYYSKFIKVRSKIKGKDYLKEKCSICGNIGITVPSTGSFVTEDIYFFNNDSNNIKNSHMKLCKTCNSYLFLAEDKIKKSLSNNIMLIPKLRYHSDKGYEKFIKVLNNNEKSFLKINEIMKDNDLQEYFDIDFIIYTKERNDTSPIEKYVENYKSYLVKFNNICLIQEDKYNYLFDERINFKDDNNDKLMVNNIFDIENIFKKFFINIGENNKIIYLNYYFLFEIYYKEFKEIVKKLDSSTISLFTKYMHNIFSFIYELNLNALNKNMINEIVLNCIKIYIRKSIGEKEHEFDNIIKRRLNEYYMLINEFWGFKMLNKDSINEIKSLYKSYDDKNQKDEEIIQIVESDQYIKYYLIGQFIRLIDNSKHQGGIKNNVFYDYMMNVNRNNIKNLFATEILQKNIFYIDKMNKKGKLLFKIIESDLELLFNEENMSYEDYLLTLCTGYYTENILRKSEGEENE